MGVKNKTWIKLFILKRKMSLDTFKQYREYFMAEFRFPKRCYKTFQFPGA